jgi:osmotically inducible protein OsmC
MKVKYTAHATASKGGRGMGTAATDDGKVSVIFSQPKEMGGDSGPGTNPEQLFAVGYSACFLGAMRGAAKRLGETLPEDATLTATISFVDREDGVGNTIAAALEAKVPGMERTKVDEIMQLAHNICPYSHAIKATVDVKFSVA